MLGVLSFFAAAWDYLILSPLYLDTVRPALSGVGYMVHVGLDTCVAGTSQTVADVVLSVLGSALVGTTLASAVGRVC